MNAVVYCITNTLNGKQYIGVSTNPDCRQAAHLGGWDKRSVIARATKKYGKDNFTFVVLLRGDEEYCYYMEPRIIEAYGYQTPNGYNVAEGGSKPPNASGRKHTTEAKQRMSEAKKGKPSGRVSPRKGMTGCKASVPKGTKRGPLDDDVRVIRAAKYNDTRASWSAEQWAAYKLNQSETMKRIWEQRRKAC